MKKKLLLFTCLILSATLLSGCGSSVKKTRTTTRPAAVTAAPVTPSPTPVPTAAPAPTPEPTPIVVPISTPVPTPSFTFPPSPVTTYAPTPVQTGLPRVTKDPTDEIVPVNGECMFIARYENADLAEWHFVSPDGSLDVSYAVVQSYFPELRIIGGSSKDLTLQNIPEALNGESMLSRVFFHSYDISIQVFSRSLKLPFPTRATYIFLLGKLKVKTLKAIWLSVP